MSVQVNRSVISKEIPKLIVPISIQKGIRKDGEEDGRGIFRGVFVKVNGDFRVMEFCFSKKLIQKSIDEGKMVKVKEVYQKVNGEKSYQWRSFNFGKMIGDIVQCN